MRIIGISGKAETGKSTLAKYLTEKYGYKEYSFATPLKEILKILRFTDEQLYGTGQQKLEKNEHWGYCGREAMQKIGTEVFRDFLPTILPNMKSPWIRLFEIEAKTNLENYVISDVRMSDEADVIRKLGGIIIRTVRTVPDHKEENSSVSDTNFRKHSSETESDRIVPDFVLDNDKNTLEDSRKVIDEYIASFPREKSND